MRSLQTAVSSQCASVCQLERPLPSDILVGRARLASERPLAVSLHTTHEVRIDRIGRRHVSPPDIALCVARRSCTCRIFHSFF